VWWAYGFLRQKERDLWVKWGAMLENAFREERLNTDFQPPYHFHWKARCTDVELWEIWQSSCSAALFWVSHGHAGYPIPYDYAFEKRDPTQEESVESRLEPLKMPKAGSNLRALALISCESHFHESDWEKLLDPKAAIKTFVGIVEDSAKPKAEITQWMRYRWPDNLKTAPAAQRGARYMLRNLVYVGPSSKKVQKPKGGAYTQPGSGGCCSPFSLRARVPGPTGASGPGPSAAPPQRGPLGYA
jgi:hypothetical protein